MRTLPDLGRPPVESPPRPAPRRRAATVVLLVLALGASLLAWRLPADRLTQFLGSPGLRPGVDVPTRPQDAAPAPRGAPEPAPYGTGGYAFLHTHDSGAPVAFDPCRSVPYVVRRGAVPARGEELLAWAIERLSRASGLVFVEEGTTDERATADRASYQPERYGDRWAPVLVDWTDGAPGTGFGPDVLGRAGPAVFATTETGSARIVSGVAAFNGPAIQQLLDTGREPWARAVLLHELGHLVGLGHVDDPHQVMHGVNAAPVARYRDGDLRGLELLGTGRCFTDY